MLRTQDSDALAKGGKHAYGKNKKMVQAKLDQPFLSASAVYHVLFYTCSSFERLSTVFFQVERIFTEHEIYLVRQLCEAP